MEQSTTTAEFIIMFYKWNKLQSNLQQLLINDPEAARDIIEEVVV